MLSNQGHNWHDNFRAWCPKVVSYLSYLSLLFSYGFRCKSQSACPWYCLTSRWPLLNYHNFRSCHLGVIQILYHLPDHKGYWSHLQYARISEFWWYMISYLLLAVWFPLLHCGIISYIRLYHYMRKANLHCY